MLELVHLPSNVSCCLFIFRRYKEQLQGLRSTKAEAISTSLCVKCYNLKRLELIVNTFYTFCLKCWKVWNFSLIVKFLISCLGLVRQSSLDVLMYSWMESDWKINRFFAVIIVPHCYVWYGPIRETIQINFNSQTPIYLPCKDCLLFKVNFRN